MDAFRAALVLTVKSMVVGTRWAGRQRRLWLETAWDAAGNEGALRERVAVLQARVECLTWQNAILRTRLRELGSRKPYSWWLRLQIVWHLECFAVARRRVKEHLVVPRGTLYGGLKRLTVGDLAKQQGTDPVNKTPREIGDLIWPVFRHNSLWGRHRIAMVVWRLGASVAASTVRNTLRQPRPKGSAPQAARARAAEMKPGQTVARHPNHAWSVDRARVWRWRIWPTWVSVATDHFSRAVTIVYPLEGPNTGWIVAALENAFLRYGPPKHIITDQEGLFTSRAFAEFLRRRNVKQRLGAVGKHGSTGVTGRTILTPKQEWLRRVAVTRGPDHLSQLLDNFGEYYNGWRRHMTLGGAVPDIVHPKEHWKRPGLPGKRVSGNIDCRFFPDTRTTAYRLAA